MPAAQIRIIEDFHDCKTNRSIARHILPDPGFEVGAIERPGQGVSRGFRFRRFHAILNGPDLILELDNGQLMFPLNLLEAIAYRFDRGPDARPQFRQTPGGCQTNQLFKMLRQRLSLTSEEEMEPIT